MASPLLVNKLHRPSPRALLVPRGRILQKLDQGLTCRLILVSAAAGFGKTTVLSDWAQHTQLPVGWLALDERDNDPTRFWTYLVAAIQRTERAIGEASLSMLQSPEPLDFEVFLTPLLNELAQLQTDLIVVLDDYHLITTPAIHDALTFLLEHLPNQIHLAIATRADPPLPLARWRVRGQLTELRAAELRFSDAEATAFLQQFLTLPLDEVQVATVQRQTEGWIAGLQLAMLSLRDAADPTVAIETFRGNQRYVLDYLVEEVLEHQPPPLRAFLLRTSILEQMCGPLCEAVIGEAVDGAATLEHLEGQNLFVVPLGRDGQGPAPEGDCTWYRYHHLFAESLRHLLQRAAPDLTPIYHHRAAQWYEHQGYIADALEHAIAAGSFEYAADLIEQEMQTNENPRLDTIVVQKALAAMPPKLTHSRPWLLAAQAWVGFTSSRFAEAIAVIQTLEQLLEQSPPATENTGQLCGLIFALKGMRARQQGDAAASVAWMEKALQLLPQDYSWLRSLILLNLGVSYFVADNYEAAKRLLPEVSRIGRARGAADPAIAGLYLQAQFLALRGHLDEATSLCQQGLDLATERRWLPTYAGVLVQVALADLLRNQNQLDRAAQHLHQSIDRAIQNQQPGLMMGYITLARVHQAQGDFEAAGAAIQGAEGCQVWLWPTILSVGACKARLHLAEGNLDAAMLWVESHHLSIEDDLRYSPTKQVPQGAELNYFTFARVLLAYGQQRSSSHLQAALRLLERLEVFAKAGGRTIRVMEALLLQGLVWQAQENRERSLQTLAQALSIPHYGNYRRLFLDEGKPMAELLQSAALQEAHFPEVNHLLAAFNAVEDEQRSLEQPLVEPLSDRELEVLHYLATGMTNQAIADRLFVSLAAVKWHARNIYAKLEVNNRTQAVARARELNLLP